MSCTMQQTQMELSITGEAMKNAVKSFTLSKRYVQIVVRASILNILYRRISINDTCLRTKKLEHLPFVAFKSTRKVKDPLLNLYISWIDGIKDAINKNYLSEIYIFMKTEQDILETYRFAMKYNTDQTKENKRTLEYVKDDTMALFQVILDLEKIEKLPRDIIIDMEITYNDTTPADYEPPGFMAAIRANCLRNPVCNVHLGTLNTGHHKLTCRAQGLKIDERALTPLPSSYHGDIDSKNIDVVEFEMDQGISKSITDKKNVPPNKKIIVHEEIIILDDGNVKNNERNKFNTSNITISDLADDNVTVLSDASSRAAAATAAASSVLDCVCRLALPIEMAAVGCGQCGRRCHAPCAGFYRDGDVVGADFRCNRCDTTDTIMATFNASDANLLAIIRLILFFANKNKALPDNIIELIDESHKKMIFRKLKEFEIYTTDKKTGKGSFNRDNLERAAPLFFNTDNSQFLH